MGPYQDSSSLSSLQLLIEELKNLIALESSRKSNPWIRGIKLTELFYEKYGLSPEEVAKAQGHSGSLRSLLRNTESFSIRGSSLPQEFHISSRPSFCFGFQQVRATSFNHRGKRHRKAKQILSPLAQRISEYQPIPVPEFKSVNDLKAALVEIIKSLTANHSRKNVTIGELSKKFGDYYKQPIRPVMREVCPDMKLIELLQTIPSLHVQELENGYQISVEIHY